MDWRECFEHGGIYSINWLGEVDLPNGPYLALQGVVRNDWLFFLYNADAAIVDDHIVIDLHGIEENTCLIVQPEFDENGELEAYTFHDPNDTEVINGLEIMQYVYCLDYDLDSRITLVATSTNAPSVQDLTELQAARHGAENVNAPDVYLDPDIWDV